jgi:asparagine synthase (glutamine-hydrolysing)
MCGIWLYFAKNNVYDEKKIQETADKLIPRGPDMQSKKKIKFGDYTLFLNFYRLSIMDLSTAGMQPFFLEDEFDTSRKIYLLCNGEIYNYSYLVQKYNLKDKLTSNSDCEILIHLYKTIGIDKLYEELNGDEVSGEFAMTIIDLTENTLSISIARDMGGVRPLYISSTSSEEELFETLCITSQLRGIPYLDNSTLSVQQFRPYSYCTYNFVLDKTENIVKFKNAIQVDKNIRDIPITIFDENEAMEKIRDTLIKCVEQRMQSDREIMFMCSGGLDSSLCAGIGAKFAERNSMKIKTMSIGLEGGTDEFYAKMVGDYIKSEHQHILCSEEEFLDSAKNRVIDTVESYDITTIRASTGQLIAAEKISKFTNCKVVIIGDYSDEITGGYNETKYAPTLDDYTERIYELVENIHYFDAQRADRCIAMNGLEARTPFGDHRFIKLYLSIDPKLKTPRNGVEKYLLRKAFDLTEYIPSEVLWRPKEAFSDGVSSVKKSWYKILQEDINKTYKDEEVELAKEKFKINIPYTKESLYYRDRFCKTYSDNVANVIPYFWLPKWGNIKDPSARVLDVYRNPIIKS